MGKYKFMENPPVEYDVGSYSETRVMNCHECNDMVPWKATVMFLPASSKLSMGYKCTQCGKLVPMESWEKYQRSGIITRKVK